MEQDIPCLSPRLRAPQVSLISGRNWDKAWAHISKCQQDADCKDVSPGRGTPGEPSPSGSSRMRNKESKSFKCCYLTGALLKVSHAHSFNPRDDHDG